MVAVKKSNDGSDSCCLFQDPRTSRYEAKSKKIATRYQLISSSEFVDALEPSVRTGGETGVTFDFEGQKQSWEEPLANVEEQFAP